MKHTSSLPPAGMTCEQELILHLETFLNDNYLFRHNLVSDMVEYCNINETDFRPLGDIDFNSIVLSAKRNGIQGQVRNGIQEIIHSDFVQDFDPAIDYLSHLPEWDGRDRVEQIFYRLPGITAEQVCLASRWLHSCVAHWLGMDEVYGNQTVLMLIGPQGCGKSTFAQRLLPHHLQRYFIDHLNLSNNFDKEMALTNSMLVNIDEIDQVTASQQAQLKQTITKNTVNGRKIYGRTHQLRRRLASFIATTNNAHPLKDPTGSRRFCIIRISDDAIINNAEPIDYDQLYAQLVYELKELRMPYWFNDAETRRIQQLNTAYYANVPLDQMILSCFRKPIADERPTRLSSSQILTILNSQYPTIRNNHSMLTRLGTMLTSLGFQRHRSHTGNVYDVITKTSIPYPI